MDICIFKNLKTVKPQLTSLEKIVEIIKTSPLLKEYTLEARHYYATGEKKKLDSIKKNELPAYAPAGLFIDGKGKNNLIGLTGLCFIDIDDITEEQVDSSMALLRENENVLLATRSLSGNGLHILVPYILLKDDPITPLPMTTRFMSRLYKSVFILAAEKFSNLLGYLVDLSLKNPACLCLVAYDPDAWFNPSAKPIPYHFEKIESQANTIQFDLYEE